MSLYWTTVYERNGKNLFWSIKNSCEILNKLKFQGFLASSLSIYDLLSASLAMSTSVLKAVPGKFDIKRHSPSILYL